MEAKRAFGIVTAVGTRLGKRAREDPGLLDEIRAAPDAVAFRSLVRRTMEGILPPAVLDAFCEQVVADHDWAVWRSRLLLQAKMVRDGGKPAPGHEAQRGGAGRP